MPPKFSLTPNADTDTLTKAYLSAFGISGALLPTVFRPEFEDAWEAWVDSYYMVHTPIDAVLRTCAFIEILARKGKTNPYVRPPRLTGLGKRLTPKYVYDTITLSTLSAVALDISTMFRRTDLLSFFKIARLKSDCTTKLITCLCLERRHRSDRIEDIILYRLRDILKSHGTVAAQLQEKVIKVAGSGSGSGSGRSAMAKKPPKIVTPKDGALLVPIERSFDWLPLSKSASYDSYLIRARDARLVLKVVVRFNPRLLASVPKATVLRLWAQAFRAVR